MVISKMNEQVSMTDGVTIRWLLIPDYSETESFIIYFGNHAYIDGVQFFSMLQAMTVEKDFRQLPRVSPPSIWANILSFILTPYATLRVALHLITLPYERNCIK